MIQFIRWMLFPFSVLYATAVWLRNWAFDNRLYKATSFQFPVVVIGNLAVGGTGKSPMTAYVLRLVKPHRNVAVLSRGYGRNTKGFRRVEPADSAAISGDEPLQIKRNFPDTTVVVCEDRVHGIRQIQNEVDAVLLDDAYQHRKLQPSFSILLIDFESLQHPVLPLPTGNFRELLPASKRANVIVITKCPDELSEKVKFSIESRLRKHTHVPIFYTKIAYEGLLAADGTAADRIKQADTTALVITGIAKPEPLLSHLTSCFKSVIHMAYPDHHRFSADDLDKIGRRFGRIDTPYKIIITTEKDMQRLPFSFTNRYPVYFLPIEPAFLFGQADMFDLIVRRAFLS